MRVSKETIAAFKAQLHIKYDSHYINYIIFSKSRLSSRNSDVSAWCKKGEFLKDNWTAICSFQAQNESMKYCVI